MIFELFKISDTDGTVLNLFDFLKIEHRCDNVQTFDTRCDETIMEMQNQPDEELLDNLYFRQLEKSGQLKQLVALCIVDTVQRSEPRSYTKFTRIVTPHLEQDL